MKSLILARIAICLMACLNSALAQHYQLITSDTQWRFSHRNLEFGTAWRAPGYDDTIPGWEGPSNILFGFETTPSVYSSPASLIPPQNFRTQFPSPMTENPYVTNYYFRTHFSAPSLPAHLASLSVIVSTNYIDDGCIYYLNGVEVVRYNMPAGPVNAATWALASLVEGYSPSANETIFIRTNGLTNLILGGDNVMAIEVHNATNTSSDEVFGMTLALIVPEPIVITSEPIGQTNLIGPPPITLSVGVTGSDPSYQWYSNDVKIAGATLPAYSVSTSRTTAGADYYVVITNVLNRATSALARVAVVTDNFPIQLLQAFAGPPAPPGTTLQNQVILYFNKPILRNAAFSNLANYEVTIFGTTNTLVFTNVQVAAGTIRLAATSDFIFGTNYVLTVYNVTGTNAIPLEPNPTQIGISMTQSNPLPPVVALFPIDQSWRENENLTDLGAAWRGTNYDEDANSGTDGVWGDPTPALFVNDSGNVIIYCPGYTIGANVSLGIPTYYFRTRFVPPAGTPASGTIHLRYFHDDGAIFYLNGTEIWRDNLPAGAVNYSTPGTMKPPVCLTATISIINLLRPGINVMAAELHESGVDAVVCFGASLDYTTNYSIMATNTSPLPPKVAIVQQAPNWDVISWSSNQGGLNWGLEFNPELKPTGWTALPDSSPYTNSAASGRRYFRAFRK